MVGVELARQNFRRFGLNPMMICELFLVMMAANRLGLQRNNHVMGWDGA
jgi:hypothetical protein